MLSSAETSWPPTLPRPPQLPLSAPTLPPQPSRFQQPPPPPTSLFLQPEAREPPACKPTPLAFFLLPVLPAAREGLSRLTRRPTLALRQTPRQPHYGSRQGSKHLPPSTQKIFL